MRVDSDLICILKFKAHSWCGKKTFEFFFCINWMSAALNDGVLF